jgi:UV DNA damage endonuclease
MLRWNDRYGIKFLRLSSEMFPFASHAVYGYQLAPFASDVLAEAGKTAAKLGHRSTTHPSQVGRMHLIIFRAQLIHLLSSPS